MSPSALVPPSLSPQALAPCEGQWGSPRWQQDREDRIWAGGCSLLLPTLVMLLPAREGTLCRARGGCTRQPNSPNSPSGCKTQPVQLPCMYKYLHMYTYVLRADSCPALRTHHDTQGWGHGAFMLCQPLTNTHTWHETHTPCSPFLVSLDEVWGWVGQWIFRDGPLGFLYLRQAAEERNAPLTQAWLQPLPAARPIPAPSCGV